MRTLLESMPKRCLSLGAKAAHGNGGSENQGALVLDAPSQHLLHAHHADVHFVPFRVLDVTNQKYVNHVSHSITAVYTAYSKKKTYLEHKWVL
jgi:hypothetical protein